MSKAKGRWEKARYNTFEKDVKGEGFTIKDHEDEGKNFEGPAVVVSDVLELQKLRKRMKVELQYEKKGKGFLVFPT